MRYLFVMKRVKGFEQSPTVRSCWVYPTVTVGGNLKILLNQSLSRVLTRYKQTISLLRLYHSDIMMMFFSG